MSIAKHHAEWLSLMEVSGPFLTMPVLEELLPNGLDSIDATVTRPLREQYEQWQKNPGPTRHDWVLFVLRTILELPKHDVVGGQSLPPQCLAELPEFNETVRPDYVLLEPAQGAKNRQPTLLVSIYKPGTRLEAPLAGSRSSWSPAQRMAELCKNTKVPLGLVTDGERWMLVHAPWGQTVTYVSWYAALWLEEPLTLRAFITLLHHRRFFGLAEEETLPRLMERSAHEQHRVTDTLGRQVRNAIAELLRALDNLDRQAVSTGGVALLHNIPLDSLYKATLTVMMRLVFLLTAEERGLLRLGEELYDSAYAAATLRDQLRDMADKYGEEILEYRHDAWVRFLTLFRAVHNGIEHEDIRLPAYSGSLFDPDRYPFLEGRQEDTSWKDGRAKPAPVNNRVILHLLESIQFLRDKTKTGETAACRLSFRGLDVEQIGHVYEGLLDRTVGRAPQVLLGLEGVGSKSETHIRLSDLESRVADQEVLLGFLVQETGRSKSALKNALSGMIRRGRQTATAISQASLLDDAPPPPVSLPPEVMRGLNIACNSDQDLIRRIAPFALLLRKDSFDVPVVVPARGLYIRPGSQRRDTGTHYTPKALAETLVEATLEPHVYIGPEQGLPREEWRLRSPQHILSLKVCDLAMGSGAFLVQACRYLAGKLTEAWQELERQNPGIPLTLTLAAQADDSNDEDMIPQAPDERLVLAQRLIADRCLYGVDSNPLAVEMAKLSLWLITLQRDRPFTFIDHALKCGDSLLGIYDVRQLQEFTLTGHDRGNAQLIFGSMHLKAMVEEGRKQRGKLERILSDSSLHVAAKEALHHEAEKALAPARMAADILVMETLANGGTLDADAREVLVDQLFSPAVAQAPDAQKRWWQKLEVILRADNPGFSRPFHWALEFPEIFDRKNGGFDAIVGNPPFLGSQRMREALGHQYREYLVEQEAGGARGQADLVAYFFLRAAKLVRKQGDFGLIATNTLAQGDTREVGLLQLEQAGYCIRSAWPDVPWTGSATVATSQVCLHRDAWSGRVLLRDEQVKNISSFLTAGSAVNWRAQSLMGNNGLSFQGSIILGSGFLLDEKQAQQWITEDPSNKDILYPYLGGEDLTTHPEQKHARWVINFWDWDEERAKIYSNAYKKVDAEVRQIRQQSKSTSHLQRKKYWWQFAERCSALYHAVGRGHAFVNHPKHWTPTLIALPRVLVISQVSKHGVFSFVPNDSTFAVTLIAFASADAALFALLQSGIHRVWAYKMCSKMRTDLRYTPSSAFETFPRPHYTPEQEQSLRDLGETLHQARADVMKERWIGLTTLYNQIHDPDVTDADILRLRDLHAQVDAAVAEGYGWDDLDVSHAFHRVAYLPENDRVRHTFSEETRLELLDRLTLLNKERWEEEQLTAAPAPKKSKGKKKAQREDPSLLDLL